MRLMLLLFAVACRSSTPSVTTDGTHNVQAPRVIEPEADAGATTETATAPVTVLADDEVAVLVLRDYDRTTHRVKVLPPPADAGPELADGFGVRPTSGSVLYTHADDAAGKGAVHVESKPGDDWAMGDRVAWVVVGDQHGFCMAKQGFLALFEQHKLLAIAPWMGSCRTPSDVRFVTAAGRGVMLESDGNTGEDGLSEETERVWVVSQGAWKNAGSVAHAFEETFEPGPLKGIKRAMDATIAGTPAGLVSTETWHFTSLATNKTTDRTRTLTYALRGDTVVTPRDAPPKP